MNASPRLKDGAILKVLVPVVLLAVVLAAPRPLFARQESIRILFLHHSTGHNLIEQGGVREGLSALGYEFYDHGYNGDGLRLADGSYTGTNFDVPGDNTDPDGYADIFAQPLHDPPDNTFSHLMQYDVIIFKSCFPTSNIDSDEQLADYQRYYLAIRDRMDQYPDKVFIVVTPPPQVPNNTNAAEGRRARAFANWLASNEYLGGRSNVFTFDFFDQLAADDNFLRREYRSDPWDAHPNEQANAAIGPVFVAFIDGAITESLGSGPRPETADVPSVEEAPDADEVPEAVAEGDPAGSVPSTVGLIEGFEVLTGPWESGADESGSWIECGADPELAYDGQASLLISYEVRPDGWADCGTYYEAPQDWSGGAGLSFWLRADRAGQTIRFIVFSGQPEPQPYQVTFQITDSSTAGWMPFFFPWDEFGAPEWVDASDLPAIDPARMTGYGFSFSEGAGAFWLDDLAVADGADSQPAEAVPVQADDTQIEEEPAVAAESSSRGLCAGAALAPVLMLGVLWTGSFRRRQAAP